jgi:plastocyanin
MHRTGILVTVSLVLGLASAARAADHVVGQKDKTFSAAALTVKAGDSITFKNDDQITHNVFSTAKENEFNLRAQAPGTSAAVTLAAEGTVEIRCAFHPKMRLVVTVTK